MVSLRSVIESFPTNSAKETCDASLRAPPAPASHCSGDAWRPQERAPASSPISARTCQKPCTRLAYARRLGGGQRLEHGKRELLASPRSRLRKFLGRAAAERGLSRDSRRVVHTGRDARLAQAAR